MLTPSRIGLLGMVAGLMFAGIGAANAGAGSSGAAAPLPIWPQPFGSYTLRTLATLAPPCESGVAGLCNDPNDPYCCTYTNYQYKLEMSGRFVIGPSAAVYQGRLTSDWSRGVEVDYQPIKGLRVVGTDNGQYLRGTCDVRGGGVVGEIEGQGAVISCTLKLDAGPWVHAYYQTAETDWGTSYSADQQYEYRFAAGKYFRDFPNLPFG